MKKTTEKKVIRQRFILDESGSMYSQTFAVIGGFNEQLEKMRREEKELKVKYLISLTKFSYTATVVYKDQPLRKVSPLTNITYRPDGGTALLDALGENLTDGGEYECLVTIMTDGEENASSKWNREQIKTLIEMRQNENNWGFVYFGANQDSWHEGGRLGIYNTVNYTVNNTSSALNAMEHTRRSYNICAFSDDFSSTQSELTKNIDKEALNKN